MNILGIIFAWTLQWNLPTGGGVPTGYEVHFGTVSGNYTALDVGNTLTWPIPATHVGRRYYAVKAYNAGGKSPLTPEVFADIVPPAPGTPLNLRVVMP